MEVLLNDALKLERNLVKTPPSATSRVTQLVEDFVIKYDDCPPLDAYSLGNEIVVHYDDYAALEIRNDVEYKDLALTFVNNVIDEINC